ncbi:MAG: peptidoglycan endopeptidase [Chlamydiia bacterium]|nr:peptidoglycan endopeptidase [Chlamydiia bacterium]
MLSQMRQWIQIATAAPILNTSRFRFAFGGASGTEIPLNEKGHPYCFEWVALAGMQFEVAETVLSDEGRPIYRLLCPNYTSAPNYLDARFATKLEEIESFIWPSRDQILRQMEALIGTPYVWGGNWSYGIPELLAFYPPQGTIDPKTEVYWTLKGIDCSGLLFQILRGQVPRNSSELLQYGKEVPIDLHNIAQILDKLNPLDILHYPGHVIFVFDKQHTIESKSPFGVVQRNTKQRLEEIFDEKRPLSVRRFL